MFKRAIPAFFVVLLAAFAFSSAAQAETQAPGYAVFGFFNPTDLAPGGTGVLTLEVYDVGAESSSGVVTVGDRLPKGLEAVSEMPAGPGVAEGTEVAICELSPGSLPPLEKSGSAG